MKFLKLYEPFKVAQRYLALIFCVPYATIGFMCCTAMFISGFMPPCETDVVCYAQHVKDSQKETLTMLNEVFGWLVITIVGFYFAGGVLEGNSRAKVEASKK